MHHLPRYLSNKLSKKMENQASSPKPKLFRRNAIKNFDYTPSSSMSPTPAASSGPRARSLDFGHSAEITSFRVEGGAGEYELICQSIGVLPEELHMSAEDFERMKIKSSADATPSPKGKELLDYVEPTAPLKQQELPKFVDKSPKQIAHKNEHTEIDCGANQLKSRNVAAIPPFVENVCTRGGIKGDRPPLLTPPPAMPLPVLDDERSPKNDVTKIDLGARKLKPRDTAAISPLVDNGLRPACNGVNKGDRPSLLAPPPAMSLPVLDDGCSTWDLFNGLAADSHRPSRFRSLDLLQYSDDEEEVRNHGRIGETVILSGSCSFTTTNDDDDSSSSTTEPVSIISPNGVCKVNISQWEKGTLLGKGSFGTVYEGISCEGFFFAVKEVSLLEQGSQGRQSIYQLEQEIELLSQFEHENIVRYLGTETVDSKLYIFLELVTQGSLAKLYQQYSLRDSHVSAYTRQILQGLKYLHDKNVVHRDIKSANILVASNGTVKLADFGLAKATRLNDLKSCKGTAFWMAPEVVNHKNKGYGLPADIWSLGCTVLEMLTGHLPYYPLEFMQALFRIGKGVPPTIPDQLSSDARDFIQQCIRVNPNDRPTAAELLEHQFVRRPLNTSLGSESPMMRGRSI